MRLCVRRSAWVCAKMEAQGEDDAEVDDLDPDADDLDLRLARLEHLMDRCAQWSRGLVVPTVIPTDNEQKHLSRSQRRLCITAIPHEMRRTVDKMRRYRLGPPWWAPQCML